jgi:hypothetical protein
MAQMRIDAAIIRMRVRKAIMSRNRQGDLPEKPAHREQGVPGMIIAGIRVGLQ